MARKFFYVCAGVLMLALSFQLGAREASGQATAQIDAVNFDNGALFVVVNGTWMHVDPHTGQPFEAYPIPVRAPLAEIGNDFLLYKNGDMYVYQSSAGAWVFQANLLGRGPR